MKPVFATWIQRIVWVIGLSLALTSADNPGTAEACGGPDYGDLSVLRPIGSHLSHLTHVDVDWDYERIEQLKFSYPLVQARPKVFAELEAFRLGKKSPGPALSTSALDSAMQLGDLVAAEREARALVQAWLALPSLPAVGQRKAMWRAVELIELAPTLTKLSPKERGAFWTGGPLPRKARATLRLARQVSSRPARFQSGYRFTPAHPRAASLELWALDHQLKTSVPNGWQSNIQKTTPAHVFTGLRQSAARWLARHPRHPLTDYTRLYQVRIEYLAGDFDAVWNTLIQLYPRHPQRSAGEMFYLLRTGHNPSPQVLPRVSDPPLLTALTSPATLDAERFATLWAVSKTAPKSAWAINLQERLLHWAARLEKSQPLPATFPRTSTAPSSLWGQLRAITLAKHGQRKPARKQLKRLTPSPSRSALLGSLYLDARLPDRAFALSELSRDSRRFLAQVFLSTAQLRRHASRQKKNSPGRALAQLELATRAARRGNWKLARARVRDPQRRARFARAARLAQSRTTELQYARFLNRNYGSLFFEVDTGYLRGLSSHYSGLKTKDPQRKRIQAAMVRADERWLALKAYTRWLERHSSDGNARAVLGEADRIYIRMTSSGGADGFWSEYAGRTRIVRRLRKVGARIRRGSSGPTTP